MSSSSWINGDAAPSEDRSLFNSEQVGVFLWRYPKPHTRIYELYEKAKEKAWNPTTDLVWNSTLQEDRSPLSGCSNPLNGFAGYESLNQHEKLKVDWQYHAIEISELLHGEQAAMIVSAQLIACMPSMETKLFACSQAIDEGRHVEFFSRYLRGFSSEVRHPSSHLKHLIEETISDSRWHMKFLVCQILIESLAMSRFQELRENASEPTLRDAVDRIVKDESRHVRFGVEVLREHFRESSVVEKERLGNWVLENMLWLSDSENIYVELGRERGWDAPALRFHLRTHRLRNAQTGRSRLKILSRNLDAIGMLTEKLERRITAMTRD